MVSAVYGHVDGSVLLSFSCSSFACGLFLFAEMPEYYSCCGKFVWPSGNPPEDWEVSWEPMLCGAANDFAL
jgi:hypothetical protein